MAVTLNHIPRISEGDVDICSIDCEGWLDESETLATFSEPVEITTSDLSFSNNQVSTADLVIAGRTCPAGRALQFIVSGQEAGKLYRVRLTCTTSYNRRKIFDIRFKAE